MPPSGEVNSPLQVQTDPLPYALSWLQLYKTCYVFSPGRLDWAVIERRFAAQNVETPAPNHRFRSSPTNFSLFPASNYLYKLPVKLMHSKTKSPAWRLELADNPAVKGRKLFRTGIRNT